MLYSEWVEDFYKKHRAIVIKLEQKGFSDDEIIEYFDYENMVKNEADFCPLYKMGKKCHDIKELNCYLCACPNFRYNDDGIGSYSSYKILSKCSINNGTSKGIDGAIHQDCTKCTVPHHRAYIKKHFDRDWLKIMKECRV